MTENSPTTEKFPPSIACLRLPGGDFLLVVGQTVRIGRSLDNDVILNDPMVSRSHAVIEWNGDGFTLTDLGSVNGTFVNSARLISTSRQLRDGDDISVGGYEFQYEILRETQQETDDIAQESPETVQRAGPSLLVKAGPDMGQEYLLWGETILIGRTSREATWEIRLTDRSVSRPHARLDRKENGYLLTDLESANGTYLNGEKVDEPKMAYTGDVIRVGESSLVLYI